MRTVSAKPSTFSVTFFRPTERAMQHKLISGDNHIDLTYCPADLWSSQAPAKWKKHAPRVEERNDGQHWFVDDKDRGMWNGVGPGFLPYTKGSFDHVDEMKDARLRVGLAIPAPQPRPTTPELRIADLDRDGLEKEIIYGCLMVNDLIDDADLRVWVNARYNDWAADFAKRSDPEPRLPARDHPQHRSEGRGRRGAALRQDGAEGRRPRLQAHEPAALPPRTGTRCGRRRPSASSRSRSIRPASRRCARPTRPRWKRKYCRPVAAGALDAVPARHDGGAGLAARLGRLREVSRLQLRAGRIGRDLAALRVRPAATPSITTAPAASASR